MKYNWYYDTYEPETPEEEASGLIFFWTLVILIILALLNYYYGMSFWQIVLMIIGIIIFFFILRKILKSIFKRIKTTLKFIKIRTKYPELNITEKEMNLGLKLDDQKNMLYYFKKGEPLKIPYNNIIKYKVVNKRELYFTIKKEDSSTKSIRLLYNNFSDFSESKMLLLYITSKNNQMDIASKGYKEFCHKKTKEDIEKWEKNKLQE